MASVLRALFGCCSPWRSVNINGRSYKLTILGEGGFSYVYLGEEISTGQEYAIKVMTCQDEATLKEAMREAELYQIFEHPNIIKLVDSCVLPSTSANDAQDVYMVLPIYKRGSLQDIISKPQKYVFSESELLQIAYGLSDAIAQLHHFKPPNANVSTPLAHRDIKPGNVLLSADNSPILMDFGSIAKARITVNDRNQALALMDIAAERCTMPYRAPELFEIASGSTLDERVDIWSLGCTIYAVAYGISPFERTAISGSLALAIINAKYSYPTDDPYSDDLHQLIDFMLVPDKDKRPFIDDVLRLLRDLMEQR